MKLLNKTVSLSKETDNLIFCYSIFNIHNSGTANNLILIYSYDVCF